MYTYLADHWGAKRIYTHSGGSQYYRRAPPQARFIEQTGLFVCRGPGLRGPSDHSRSNRPILQGWGQTTILSLDNKEYVACSFVPLVVLKQGQFFLCSDYCGCHQDLIFVFGFPRWAKLSWAELTFSRTFNTGLSQLTSAHALLTVENLTPNYGANRIYL